jgi:naphtho-gamma-pyrone polyketide synthase
MDLGVDSLLSLTIAGSLSSALGTNVSSNFLLENGTLEEIEVGLSKDLGLDGLHLKEERSTLTGDLAQRSMVHDIVSSPPHATSIILQGRSSKLPSKVLFLLPDGSGSASSYASLAKLGPDVAVYGLNCPWRTTPEDMARVGADMSQLVSKYIIEIRQIQPRGPYRLGGWSAGGICAFEAARQLQAAGDVVDKLVLLDSPNPIGLENPPARMYDFFESLGIFGGPSSDKKPIPKWLRQHFDAFIGMLDKYEPRPLSNAPPTVIIYARDGICNDMTVPRPELRADDPREMMWLLNNRTDFSADGWTSLLGTNKLKIHVLDNVNHFTMMEEGPAMEAMGGYLRQALIDI